MKAALLVCTVLSFSALASDYECYLNPEQQDRSFSVSGVSSSSDEIRPLRSPVYIENQAYTQTQYWADAGDDYHLIAFLGMTKTGIPKIIQKNLFCKKNAIAEEGGLYYRR